MYVGSRVHVAVSRNGRECSLYVNGQPTAHSLSTISVVYQNAFLVFGMDYQNSSNYFKGTMDHIAIFSQSLSESEIYSLYSSEVGAPTFIPTPITSILPTPASPNAAVTNGGGDTGGGNSSACDASCIIGVLGGFFGSLFVGLLIYWLQRRDRKLELNGIMP